MTEEAVAEHIRAFLESLPDQFKPLAVHARKWLKGRRCIDANGAICLCHAPNVGTEAYLMTLFPPARPAWLTARRNHYIPKSYRDILRVVNGFCAYRLELFGLAPSMQAKVPLLDRSQRQPLDLSLANETARPSGWSVNYKLPDRSLFHFGSREFSFDQNTGYFLDSAGRITSLLESGKVVGTWTSFAAFLKAELAAAEKNYRS